MRRGTRHAARGTRATSQLEPGALLSDLTQVLWLVTGDWGLETP